MSKDSTNSKTNVMSEATKKLFESYYMEMRRSIYFYVFKRVGKQEVAEDIAANVFMKLYDNFTVIDERDKNGVKAWLYTVARNAIIDHYRKEGKKTDVDLEDEIFELVCVTDGNYLKEEITKENQGEVQKAMELLDPAEKEIVTLRFNDDMKFSEIAEVLDKSEGAVKMSLYRALEKMKPNLTSFDI